MSTTNEHTHDHDPRGRHPHGGRSRRGGDRADLPGFGPGGYGTRGYGPGGFGPGGFGPGGFGPGHGFGRGRRARRGNVRNAVLALLAEGPQHGYAIIGLLAERSGGMWRPSPGSIYPVLNQLEEEGLVSTEQLEGRKVFALTEAGTTYVAEHPDELREPWTVAGPQQREQTRSLFAALQGLAGAVQEVVRGGDADQVEQARTVLESAKRSIYRVLADEPSAPESGPRAD